MYLLLNLPDLLHLSSEVYTQQNGARCKRTRQLGEPWPILDSWCGRLVDLEWAVWLAPVGRPEDLPLTIRLIRH